LDLILGTANSGFKTQLLKEEWEALVDAGGWEAQIGVREVLMVDRRDASGDV
jgi:hypothetical protein